MHGKLSDNITEVLEAVWTLEEKDQAIVDNIASEASTEVNESLLAEMQAMNLIAIEGNRRIRLSDEGRRHAVRIIRRHRLAERLLCDVLGHQVEEIEDAACEYEHLIAEGITSSICTLLGHPRLCPHNKPIPEGDCCRQAREELKPIVISCDLLDMGETARVAYIAAREHGLMRKLASLGISPGIQIKLIQKWPSFVIQCDETEIAVESDVARTIYVWRSS